VPRFSNNKRLLVLLLSLIVLTVVVSFTVKERKITWPEKVLIDTFSTVSKLVYQPVGHIAGFIDEVQNILALYKENAILKQNLRDYNTLSARLTEMEQRNKQLETALNFKKSSPYASKMKLANVTGRSPDKWNSSITIDLGEKDGIKPDMAVISPDGGLVGRVMSVGKYNSTVILITDTNRLGISAVVQDTRDVGIVQGSTSKLGAVEMGLIDREAKLAAGQKVVTSNLSTIYPAGILIGEIQEWSMEESGLTKKAILKPAAKLDRLEMVFVVERVDSAEAGK
jgi:rod shape-determining protein MreC